MPAGFPIEWGTAGLRRRNLRETSLASRVSALLGLLLLPVHLAGAPLLTPADAMIAFDFGLVSHSSYPVAEGPDNSPG